jgi:DNA-binding beta-propeller fold protein YncE
MSDARLRTPEARLAWLCAALLGSGAVAACRSADADTGGGGVQMGTGLVRWAVSSNDNKNYLDNGVVKVAAAPPPDTVSIIDLFASPPKVAAELEVPGSVQGPPLSVAVTPDESLALVTSPQKIDPADPTKLVADDRITVIDLKSVPPKVLATVTAGKQPSGISISRDGKLALVANRAEGSVSVLTIDGQTVTVVGKTVLSDPAKPDQKPQTASVAISPDGKMAIATNDGDHRLTLLSIDGTMVKVLRDFYAGLRPYAVDIAASGRFAVVGNLGFGLGDLDTVSLVDLETQPPRVVDTVTVGLTVEGVKIAPDSSYAVAVVPNGSNKPSEFAYRSPASKLVVVRIENKTLKKVAEAPAGGWAQGAAFTSDSKQILVTVMADKRIDLFQWNGTTLTDTGTHIPVTGGAAAIRTAER